MTIKTLEFIHRLLIREEQVSKEIYNEKRQLQHEYEEKENIDKDIVKDKEKTADYFMKLHFESLNALNDFENADW